MRLLFLIVFSFFVEAVFSQPFNFVTYREANGLPSGYVEHAFEDSRGYLWLSTFGGLSRFDGKNFVNYGIKEGLPSNFLDMCTEDSRGRLWIATRKGISMFDGKHFTNYPYLPDSNITTYYRYVQPQEDGNVHISIMNRLYRSSGNKLEPEAPESGFKDSAVVCRNMLPNGIKVIATIKSLYLIYPDGTKKSFTGLTAGHLRLCFRDKQLNSFYVLGTTGVYRWENDALTRISSLTFNRSILTAFFEDRQKRLWIAAESEPVRIFNTVTGNTDSITNLPILVTHFFQDRQGTIWISTFRGLVKVTESFITHFDKYNGLQYDDIRASGKPDSATVYMGINLIKDGRIDEYPADVKRVLASQKSLSNISAMVKDETGSFYIFTYTGLVFKYDGKSMTAQTAQGRIFVTGAAYDKKHSELLLAGGNTVYKMKDGVIAPAADPDIKGTTFRDINSIKADVYGNIWLNDNGDPLLRTENGFISFKPALQLPSNADAEMAYSDADGCWFKTSGYGIIHVSRNAQENYVRDFSIDKKEGLINDNALAVTRDNNNYLWVATSGGLCYINLNGRRGSGYTVHAMNADEGMDVPNWNLAYLEKDLSGNVWLGVGNGIYKLDISRLKTGSLPPAVHITDILCASRSLDLKSAKNDSSNYFLQPQQATLRYDQNNISFSFKGINLKTGVIKYSYMLEGQDKEWSSYSTAENISYNNLQPGSYIFKVKAINDYGIESIAPAAFSFIIYPPFWQTWWFRLLLAAACIFVIYIFVKRRDKSAAQKNALQLQMSELRLQAVQSQMNPHFIFNALNSIQNFIVQNNQIEAARYLSRFSKLIRRILDNSHHQFLKLDDIVETLKMYVELEAFRFNKEFTYSFHTDNSDERIYDVELPPMLLQPFAENAILHGLMPKEGEKHLKINIFIKDNLLHCIIEDNGVGRSKKTNTDHISRGEKLTHGMLESLKTGRNTEAAITCEDLKDEEGKPLGTKVIITIPVA